MNNGTVRPRVKGKAVGEAAPILYTEGETGPWTAANLTAFCVVNLIPHYFTFPPFPEERGYANEVQRARIGAATQLQGSVVPPMSPPVSPPVSTTHWFGSFAQKQKVVRGKRGA